ncbi:MAG: ATP-binding cassette domain-containing protein [Isosphaeraceae bacterium]|nr:ATP-binding cassette domain-containing protein [Isosphaeraceae bacterium]
MMFPTPTPPTTAIRPPDGLIGPSTEEAVVSIRNLEFWYGQGSSRTQALWGVDLEIGRGEIVILTGPSGSGKTTLLTVIGTLRSVERGAVRVLGHDVVRLSRAARVVLRRNVGFIFQAHNLFSSLTAFENVRMATALKPAPVAEMNQRAEAILTRLGMQDRFDHLPAQLSGGQNQRIAIARALVNEPALVLADEPTASLDPASGQEVLTLLHELTTGPARTTVLIVTHDQRVLDRADRIVNLVSGRIISNQRPALVVHICEMLKTLPQCAGLSASTLTRIAERLTVEIHRPGEILVRDGEEADRVYLINTGEAEAVAKGVTRTLVTGQIFGQLTAVTHARAEETVTVKTPMEAYVLTSPVLQEVMQTDKALADRVKLDLMGRQ